MEGFRISDNNNSSTNRGHFVGNMQGSHGADLSQQIYDVVEVDEVVDEL